MAAVNNPQHQPVPRRRSGGDNGESVSARCCKNRRYSICSEEAAVGIPVPDGKLSGSKSQNALSVQNLAEADESFGESDMKEEPCDGAKVLGKRKRVEEEYSAEKEVHEHSHVDCREKYIAMLGAWAQVHVLSSIGVDIESPDDLENPNCELRLRKPYSEDGDSDKEDHLTYNDLKEYYEKREREVLPREMWDSNWRKPKFTNVIS